MSSIDSMTLEASSPSEVVVPIRAFFIDFVSAETLIFRFAAPPSRGLRAFFKGMANALGVFSEPSLKARQCS